MKIAKMILVLTSAALMFAQGKTTMDGEKAKIAVLPFDAVKITESYGSHQSLEAGANSLTYSATAESPFADPSAIAAFADAATQRAVDAFFKTGRFITLDRTAMEKVMKEQNFQLTDNVDPNSVANIGALLGAQYIVSGQIQQVSTNPAYDPKNQSKLLGYSGTVEIQVTIVDVVTGQTTFSKRVKGSTEIGGFGFIGLDAYESTPSKAAYKGLDECISDLKKGLKTAFPVEGDIYEITKKDKKKGAVAVSITCGKDIGVKKDDRFKVYEVKVVEINGKTINKTSDVGFVVVKKVEEDGIFSTCEVEKGGKDIEAKVGAGTKLKVVSVKK